MSEPESEPELELGVPGIGGVRVSPIDGSPLTRRGRNIEMLIDSDFEVFNRIYFGMSLYDYQLDFANMILYHYRDRIRDALTSKYGCPVTPRIFNNGFGVFSTPHVVFKGGRDILSIWPRQTGKSTIASRILGYLCYILPDFRAINTAPVNKTSMRVIFEDVRSGFEGSLLHSYIDRAQSDYMRFFNGSRLEAMSVDATSHIVGRPIDIAIIDECQSTDEEKIQRDVSPMRAASGGILVYTGVLPKVYNYITDAVFGESRGYYDVIRVDPEAAERVNKYYHEHMVTTRNLFDRGLISRSVMYSEYLLRPYLEEKMVVSPDTFSTLSDTLHGFIDLDMAYSNFVKNGCTPGSSGLSPRNITVNILKGKTLRVLGVDVGLTPDRTFLSILDCIPFVFKNEVIDKVWVKTWVGGFEYPESRGFEDQYPFIDEVVRALGFDVIGIDKTGMGRGFYEDIEKKYLPTWRVNGYSTHVKLIPVDFSSNDVMNMLATCFVDEIDARRFHYSGYDTCLNSHSFQVFKHQLLKLERKRVSNNRYLKLESMDKKKYGDDGPLSAAIGTYSIQCIETTPSEYRVSSGNEDKRMFMNEYNKTKDGGISTRHEGILDLNDFPNPNKI